MAAHESLGEVLRILQGILLKQPKLKSTELLVAAESVIKQVKGYYDTFSIYLVLILVVSYNIILSLSK